MQIKIKKLHPNAVIPAYSKEGDAGMDLTAVGFEYPRTNYVKYNFGLAIEIPKGYVGLVFPRSSIYKLDQIMSNSVGVIDSGFRGEISAVMRWHPGDVYTTGERVAQLLILPYPEVEFVESNELSETERGTGGYGSSGR